MATRDDLRDIPDNTITAPILPSQDGSYRPARPTAGAIAASFAVTDNDTAPALTLEVSPETAVERETITFTVTRQNTVNTILLPLIFGPLDDPEQRSYTFATGESALTFDVTLEDDDLNDPDERVYELSLPALDEVPEDERAQYWTVSGERSVRATVTDNDLPRLAVSASHSRVSEGGNAGFYLLRRGDKGSAVVSNILSVIRALGLSTT